MYRCLGMVRPFDCALTRSAQGEVKWLMALRKSPHPERSAEGAQSKDARSNSRLAASW
jgi:hypothetical protein